MAAITQAAIIMAAITDSGGIKQRGVRRTHQQIEPVLRAGFAHQPADMSLDGTLFDAQLLAISRLELAVRIRSSTWRSRSVKRGVRW